MFETFFVRMSFAINLVIDRLASFTVKKLECLKQAFAH